MVAGSGAIAGVGAGLDAHRRYDCGRTDRGFRPRHRLRPGLRSGGPRRHLPCCEHCSQRHLRVGSRRRTCRPRGSRARRAGGGAGRRCPAAHGLGPAHLDRRGAHPAGIPLRGLQPSDSRSADRRGCAGPGGARRPRRRHADRLRAPSRPLRHRHRVLRHLAGPPPVPCPRPRAAAEQPGCHRVLPALRRRASRARREHGRPGGRAGAFRRNDPGRCRAHPHGRGAYVAAAPGPATHVPVS